MVQRLTLLAMTMLAAVQVYADVEADSKTVIGPRNLYLYDGANALMAGNPEEGVSLTLRGLEVAHGLREKKIAHANLCAGFLLLGQAETALVHCDFDESEADIRKGQELNPRSEKLKEVKGMYLDEVQPVDEEITIDDRRNKPQLPLEQPE